MSDLDDFMSNAENLEGSDEVPLDELYPPPFMSDYTEFDDIDAFFSDSSYDVETPEDYDDLEWGDLDEHTADTTDFDTHREMGETALQDWTERQMDD